jgi:hypothetical protein
VIVTTMKSSYEAVVLIHELQRVSVRPGSALREFRKTSELISGQTVTRPAVRIAAGETIAVALRTARKRLIVALRTVIQCRSIWRNEGHRSIPRLTWITPARS